MVSIKSCDWQLSCSQPSRRLIGEESVLLMDRQTPDALPLAPVGACLSEKLMLHFDHKAEVGVEGVWVGGQEGGLSCASCRCV